MANYSGQDGCLDGVGPPPKVPTRPLLTTDDCGTPGGSAGGGYSA